MDMTAVSFTDAKLNVVMRSSSLLPLAKRDLFLRRVAALLDLAVGSMTSVSMWPYALHCGRCAMRIRRRDNDFAGASWP